MRIYFFTAILLFTTSLVYGQNFPSEVWHDGKLVTIDGDTIRGKIKYDLENDLIQLGRPQNILTFASRKIHYFEIFDEVYENYRHFYAIPYETTTNYKVPILFEVLYEGNLTLMCREYISSETVPQYSPYGTRNMYNTLKLSYRYYFLDNKGEITEYYMKRKDLLDIMKKKSAEVKEFIKSNNLKSDKRSDLVRITAYYNSLLDA